MSKELKKRRGRPPKKSADKVSESKNMLVISDEEKTVRSYRKKPVVVQAARIWRPMTVETLEGVHQGQPGDWLILGVKKEMYFCKNDIFRETYESVEAEESCESVKIVTTKKLKENLFPKRNRSSIDWSKKKGEALEYLGKHPGSQMKAVCGALGLRKKLSTKLSEALGSTVRKEGNGRGTRWFVKPVDFRPGEAIPHEKGTKPWKSTGKKHTWSEG